MAARTAVGGITADGMRRLWLVLLVGLLCVTTSGVFELLVPEQCVSNEASSPLGDGNCPPTCLRCHCARPFDVVHSLVFIASPLEPVDWIEPSSALPLASPADVLHVPRPAVA